jgi:hypothetical protein
MSLRSVGEADLIRKFDPEDAVLIAVEPNWLAPGLQNRAAAKVDSLFTT